MNTDILNQILQAFGVGSIGLLAMWLYHKAVSKILLDVFSLLKSLLELMATQQEQTERVFTAAEGQHTMITLLIKFLEVMRYGRKPIETRETLRTAARTAAKQAENSKSAE
jgi:hypothetical protein